MGTYFSNVLVKNLDNFEEKLDKPVFP